MAVPEGATEVRYTIIVSGLPNGQPDVDLSFSRPVGNSQVGRVMDQAWFVAAAALVQFLRDNYPALIITGSRIYAGTMPGDPWQP